MKMRVSLKQAWSFIVIGALFLPILTLVLWYSDHEFEQDLEYSLSIEKIRNESLSKQIDSEIHRLKSVLKNKADHLEHLLTEHNIQKPKISKLLYHTFIREPSVRELMVISPKSEVIAAIDLTLGINGKEIVSQQQLQTVAEHWGFQQNSPYPELVIPLSGKDYIGSPKKHGDYVAFSLSIPIGKPGKGALVAIVDIDKLWNDAYFDHGLGQFKSSDYILDQRGALLNSIQKVDIKSGYLLTSIPLVRSALTNEEWDYKSVYAGLLKQPAYGNYTTIPSLNWILVSELLASEIITPIKNKLYQSLFVVALFSLVFLFLVLKLVNKTIKPIDNICIAINQFSRGDESINLRPSGISELDILASDFQKMIKFKLASDKEHVLSSRIFKSTHEGIVITDINGTIIDVNAAVCRATGYSREEIIGNNPRMFSSGKQSPEFYAAMWAKIKKEEQWQGEVWNRRKNGELYAQLLNISSITDDNGAILHYVGMSSDITESKQHQETLLQLAHYDLLTQLPNRTLFMDRFIQAKAHSKRTSTQLAICFLDLDNFKPVNDEYGHDVGDKLLIDVSNRIQNTIREEDTVSRQGGDEFTLLLGGIQTQEQCENLLLRLHQSLAQPYRIKGHIITIGASSGLTLYPADNQDIDTLMRHADQAMYQAKLEGKNRFHFFNPALDKELHQKTHRLNEIEHALNNNQLCMYYQPKVNMETGHVFGAEALIRWQHPEKGLIPPLEFLPALEGTELEITIGNWVIRQALMQLNEWHKKNITLEVSINVSSHHLLSSAFLTVIKETLAQHPDIDAKYLQLEILESSALGDIDTISRLIRKCQHELGVRVALDDFGTGYSSLTHMRNLPAQIIKIDQSFVRDMLEDPNDYSIIDGIISLAESFNREVIAEGVETTQHGLMLLLMGCVEAQGYGIARPMPAEDIAGWLKEHIPNQEWLKNGHKDITLKERSIRLLKLTIDYWYEDIKNKIYFVTENSDTCSIENVNKTHINSWTKRVMKDNLFSDKWVRLLNKKHGVMIAQGNSMLDKHQDKDIESIAKETKALDVAYEKLVTHLLES